MIRFICGGFFFLENGHGLSLPERSQLWIRVLVMPPSCPSLFVAPSTVVRLWSGFSEILWNWSSGGHGARVWRSCLDESSVPQLREQVERNRWRGCPFYSFTDDSNVPPHLLALEMKSSAAAFQFKFRLKFKFSSLKWNKNRRLSISSPEEPS